ncbi:glycosyltransferase family 2 protein [Kutzneria sp. 744]|uniref:glycosyltransferase family 2 protein n=1 Tax=Kutzneria sp. (strain 744) TaxID=345341 RepID=UPI0003EED728|nr:glycosyltransferase family 2 protein [Kutzneria sp. 744]EWM12910.1 dolichol-phosphate mannosyltransferase [Kutzneria sp. 744]
MPVVQPRVSIVIPVRNEARNLEVVLPRLPAAHQVVLVDGHSVDGSVEVARRCLPGIETVDQTRMGKGNALACGFARVTGDIVIMFDADGSADPGEIPRFVAALTDGADFAKGSRFRPGGGSEDITALRRAGNAALNMVTNRLMRTRFTDLCYGYNAFWTRILPVLDLPAVDRPDRQWGDGFEVETLINCRIAAAGLRIAEVPSFERDRIHGESNLDTFRDGMRVLRTILAEHRRSKRTTPAAMRARAELEAVTE